MGGKADVEIEEMADAAAAVTNRALLLDPWPEDPILRIEAKIDKVLTNHLPHVEARMTRLERIFISKQRWQFWTGLATLLLLGYLIFK